MAGYHLYYFDARGRAEIIRLSFAAANMEYEDVRLTREQWLKEKESGRPPLGQAPFLVTPDGKVLGQSQAITKYVCRLGGLSPTESFDEAIADMIVGGVEDLFQSLIKILLEKDEAKKKALMKELFEETLPNRLPKYENILKANNAGKGFFVGDKRHQPREFVETIRDSRLSVVHEAGKEVEEGNVDQDCTGALLSSLGEKMAGYQLYYFDSRGRAEIIRLSFVAANIEYEDVRLTREQWAKEKETGRPPLGQAPFLVTPDGKVLGQSQAIMKYVCRIGGLSPTESFDEAIADMIVGGVEDFFQSLLKIHMEKDEAKKMELLKEFFEETLPSRLPKYENILKANNEGKGFFVGDKLTYADIIFFDLMNLLEKGEPTAPKALEKFPLLAAHHNRVLDVPEIKKWVETRPKTEH
ncbi:Glutathione S-transferase 1 [Stylophora pistillata]|uniref:Glutathione S-transferase 1 n=2 Tax=Stylophora pistillata TaxID=50429 RepID=A0A2B4RJ40_STYPI|nr:Glutathione S-transferase 1 [Stylophora pistillata]